MILNRKRVSYLLNYFTSVALLLALSACGESSGGDSRADSTSSTPSAIDTAQHPNGVTSGSVISTDTAAMKADTTARP